MTLLVSPPTILRRDLWIPPALEDWRKYDPKTELGRAIARCFEHLPKELAVELLARITSVIVIESTLHIVRFNGPQSDDPGSADVFGIVSRRLVTDTGVADLVDTLDDLTSANFNFHALGTGTAAEAATDSALQTELTTQYSTDNTRATGSKSQPTANQFRSIGTNTVDAAVVNTEHMLMSQAATGGGIGFDRSVYSAVNLANGDSVQTTYTCTFSSGG
jgi:hypothetical protein